MMDIAPNQHHPSKEVDDGLSQSRSQLNDDLSFEERILRIILIPILDLLADNRTDINNFVSTNTFFSKNSKLFIKPWPKHCVLNFQGKESTRNPYYFSPCLVWSKDMSKIFCAKNPDDFVGGNRNNYKSIHLFGREKGYGGKIYTLPDINNYNEFIRVFTSSPSGEMLVVATETKRALARGIIRILNATNGNNYEPLKEWNILEYYDDNSLYSYIEDLAVSPCSKYIAIVQVKVDEEGPDEARIIVYDIDGNFIAKTAKSAHDTSFSRSPRVMFSSNSLAVIFDDMTDSAPWMHCIKVWRPFGKGDDDDDNNNDEDDSNGKGDNGSITTVRLGRFTLNEEIQISSDGNKLLSNVLDNENPTKLFYKFQVRTFTNNYKSLKLQKTVTMEYNDQVSTSIFTPDGMYVLCIPNDTEGGNYDNKRSTVLNLENGRTKLSPIVFHGLSRHSFDASFSPDSTRLLTVMDGKIHMVAPIDKLHLP